MISPNQSPPRWDTRTRRDPIPRPAFRRLRGYAFDPSLSLRMDTALVNEVVFKVPWEPSPPRNGSASGGAAPERLGRGPVGEYVEVIDYDPASGCFYEPVDLDKPEVLSHDIIAHETTHALLDGMHSRFIEPTHPDALAFHEAFADIVALFQHFSFPEVLRHQIGQTRGNLSSENLLGELAQQFGQAIGNYGALRNYI